jgi:hypothetical protein
LYPLSNLSGSNNTASLVAEQMCALNSNAHTLVAESRQELNRRLKHLITIKI